jgi:hypothetical protein
MYVSEELTASTFRVEVLREKATSQQAQQRKFLKNGYDILPGYTVSHPKSSS